MRKGFSLMEMVIVLAIIAIATMIAVPYFGRAARQRKLRKVSKLLMSDMMEARSWAATRRELAPGTPANFGGVRITGPTQYVIFADTDSVTNGNEVDVKAVDLLVNDPGLSAQIQDVGAIIRFAGDGTATSVSVTVRDDILGMERVVSTNGAGHISIL